VAEDFREELREALKRYAEWGLNVIPVKYGEKGPPLVKWEQYQKERYPVEELLQRLEKGEVFNLAVICGEVGKLCVIDFDTLDTFVQFMEKLREIDPEAREELKSKCPVAITGRGVHVYVRPPGKVPPTRKLGGIDVKGEGGYVVAPPSLHPSGKQYKWTNLPGRFEPISERAERAIFRAIAEVAGKRGAPAVEPGEEGARPAELRELSESEITKLVELLKPAYKRGVRQLLCLFLTGWLAKARVSPISAAKVVKRLHDETGDEDPLRMRGATIPYSYTKAGIPVSKIELAKVLGEEPYGPEVVQEESVKGRAGLLEILEQQLGEEGALKVVREIEEILQVASPWSDAVFALLDYEKRIFAVADLRRLRVITARWAGERPVYSKIVVNAAPVEVTVYESPVGGTTKFKVVFKSGERRKPVVVGPATMPEIIDALEAEGVVYASRLVRDVLPAILNAYIRKGRAAVKAELETPGFFVVDGRVRLLNWEYRAPSREELREALELLNELAEKWFAHAKEKFATVVKWFVAAPFSFVLKQRGTWMPWLYLYGATRTGKTTLCEIGVSIWGLDARARRTGASIDTIARLGNELSKWTFPIVVNEPGDVLERTELRDAVKNAVESTVARGKFVRGAYVSIPALAPLAFTSNRYIPSDDALLRRLKVVTFTFAEMIPEERAAEFEKAVVPRLSALRHVGAFIASRVEGGDPPKKPEDVVGLLEEAYRYAGLEPPAWLKLEYSEKPLEDYIEDAIEAFRVRLCNAINEAYARMVSRVAGETIKERLETVIDRELLPFMHSSNIYEDDATVYITAQIINALKLTELGITNLKSLAEMLNSWNEVGEWKYTVGKKRGRYGKSVKAVGVSKRILLSFLSDRS